MPSKKKHKASFARFHKATTRIKTLSRRVVLFVEKRPLVSFFSLLTVLVVLIVASNLLQRPKDTAVETVPQVKRVSVYRIGTAPKVTVQAQIRKSGVIQVTALTGGVIDSLHVAEGASVTAGDILVSMSSNYRGENSFSLQRQIAQQQYQTSAVTFKTQKEIIKKQKGLAEKNAQNAEELRKITEQSLSETRTLISQNEEVLELLDRQIREFEQSNPNPDFAQRSQIIALRSQQTQFTAATNQAKQALRLNEYNADDDSPPAEIAELTKEITVRQLEVQEKQLLLSLEVSRLQAQIAQITESLMFPTAPFSGTIQRVFVKEKQQVTPGTPLLVISQVTEDDPITAVVFVSKDIATRVSRFESSMLHIDENVTFTTVPSFVSTEAVQGALYAIYYGIPDQYSKYVVSEGFISVDIPIGYPDTTMIATYIPLDAVYQTREQAYVFVEKNNRAESKVIQLGYVYGRFVEVLSGLQNGDSVILSRNIIAGDLIEVR